MSFPGSAQERGVADRGINPSDRGTRIKGKQPQENAPSPPVSERTRPAEGSVQNQGTNDRATDVVSRGVSQNFARNSSTIPSPYTLDPRKLIDKHRSSEVILDEAGLGTELLQYALDQHYAFVSRVFDELNFTDRDDVALELSRRASAEEMMVFVSSDQGRRLLDRLFDELTAGMAAEDELEQAKRILLAKAEWFGLDAFWRSVQQPKMFPYRLSGFAVVNDAPIWAERRHDGKIFVKMPVRVAGTEAFREEAATLPSAVFTSGIELMENEFIGIIDYEEGGRTEFWPALYLIQLANQTRTRIYLKLAEAAELVFLGGTRQVAKGIVESVLRRMLAKAIIFLDRVVAGIQLISSLIAEHRGWIISRFQDTGRAFLRCVDIVNTATMFYGFARIIVDLPQLITTFRQAYKGFREVSGDFTGLSRAEREVLSKIDDNTESFFEHVKKAMAAAQEQVLAELAKTARSLKSLSRRQLLELVPLEEIKKFFAWLKEPVEGLEPRLVYQAANNIEMCPLLSENLLTIWRDRKGVGKVLLSEARTWLSSVKSGARTLRRKLGPQWWIRITKNTKSDLKLSERGYQVYLLKNADGDILYVGSSGGAGGVNPQKWTDRIKQHIGDRSKREWIGEVNQIQVKSDLNEMERWALEQDLIRQNKHMNKNLKGVDNLDLGEFEQRFPEADFAANLNSAEEKPTYIFDTDIVLGR